MDFIFQSLIILMVLLEKHFGEKLNNTYCRPHPIVKATDPGTFQYYPYYITMHVCQGSIKNIAPTHQRCIPIKTREVNVDVIVMNEWDKSNGYRTKRLPFTNHTECGRGCVIEPSSCGTYQRFDDNKCECTCPYSYAPTICGKKRRWNIETCSCDCTTAREICSRRNPLKVWSSQLCACVCDAKIMNNCLKKGRQWDAKKCLCGEAFVEKEKSGSEKHVNVFDENLKNFLGSQQFWYCVVIAEFVVLTMIFDLILYSKKTGILYRLANCCRVKNVSTPSDSLELTVGMEDVD